MTTAVKIPDKKDVSPTYRKAVEAAQRANKKLADHVAEAERQNQNGYGRFADGMITKGQALQRDAAGANSTAQIEEQSAASAAKDILLADPGYKRALAGEIEAMIDELRPHFPYGRVVHDAGVAGIALPALEFDVQDRIRKAKLWLANLFKLGLLDDIDKIPPELRPELRAAVEVLP